ncbi:hypothetical protein P7C71_g3360, partial [Lecanoromycetidae sp. Uapishka_2]
MSAKPSMQVHPGRGLGFLTLGASLHDVLIRFKAQPNLYPTIDTSYSSSTPLTAPVILHLPLNGFRLRFDGPDQRLRLIEVIDFTRTSLTYKDTDLVKLAEADAMIAMPSNTKGPAFRHVYRLMGPSFAGEYMPPKPSSGLDEGLYVLSYPGIALTFPVQSSAWSPDVDFVSLLSSSAASASTCLAIFDGQSWPEARQNLMFRPCPYPRSLALSSRGKEFRPDEIELAVIRGKGRIDLERRAEPTFQIILSTTTPQDLVAELGPPDAVYRKYDRRLSIHKAQQKDRDRERRFSSNSRDQSEDLADTDHSSAHTATDDSENEDQSKAFRNMFAGSSTECFYNYFHHGFDVFISYPAARSPTLFSGEPEDDEIADGLDPNQLVATKILFHGNVPGSFPFNRYRRSRWVLDIDRQDSNLDLALNSETPFGAMSERLLRIWRQRSPEVASNDLNKNPMVLNRDWNDSPGSSCEILGDWEESTESSRKGLSGGNISTGPELSNTKLYGFPGLLFEILKNDAVSCLTVY